MDDILITTYDSEAEAQEAKTYLDQQGIASVMRRQENANTTPLGSYAPSTPSTRSPRFGLYSPKKNYTQAYELIKKRKKSTPLSRWGLYLSYSLAIVSALLIIFLLWWIRSI